MKRVSQRELLKYVTEGETKLKKMKSSLDELNKLIHSLNKKHPTYRDQWIDKYNSKRTEIGLEQVNE